MKRKLDQVRDKYDFILIDCPPSLGLMTLNALVASQEILIPIQAEFYALEGLSQLVKTVQVVTRKLNPGLSILGILLTMFDGRTNLSLQVADEVKKYFGNKVFRKGKSENLKFKHSGELSDKPLAVAEKTKDIRQKIKVKKVLLGKAEHYYVKAQVGLFVIENQELNVGDKILISGPTTGNQELVLEKMFVNGTESSSAKVGDKVTFEVPFRVRLSDKLFKIIS